MIKFKLTDRRTNVSKRIDALKEQLEELPKEFMRRTVDEIVAYSPVDTGTYMDSHNIGEVGEPASSKGKPQNQLCGRQQVPYHHLQPGIPPDPARRHRVHRRYAQTHVGLCGNGP